MIWFLKASQYKKIATTLLKKSLIQIRNTLKCSDSGYHHQKMNQKREVERILDRKINPGSKYVYYLVQWKGLPIEQAEWMNRCAIERDQGVKEMIQNFKQRQPQHERDQRAHHRANLAGSTKHVAAKRKTRSSRLQAARNQSSQGQQQRIEEENLGSMIEEKSEEVKGILRRSANKEDLKRNHKAENQVKREKDELRIHMTAVKIQDNGIQEMIQVKLEPVHPDGYRRAIKILQPDLTVLRVLLNSGNYLYEVQSSQGVEVISKFELIQRNYMALVNYYEARIAN